MEKRGGSPSDVTSRRRLLQSIAAGSLGVLAGCGAGENDLTSSSSVFGHSFAHLISQAQVNPWSFNYPRSFSPLIFEYLSVKAPGQPYQPGDIVENVEKQGATVTVEFSDEYSWWNGTPVTARDVWVEHQINTLRGARDRPTLTLLDDYTLQYEYDEPLARPLVYANQLSGLIDTPVWIYDSWRQRLEDASTDSRQETVEMALSSMTIELEEAAKRGVGCGPYTFEHVDVNRLIMRRFEDHPNADRLSIPRLWFPPIEGPRVEELQKKGWIDGGTGMLSERGPPAASGLEQLDEYPINGGPKLVMNWENPHLRRRNVRRALLTALPLPTIINSVDWGIPSRVQTGLAIPAQRRWIQDDIRRALHRYPREADTERAAAFMRRAGYVRRGDDRWVGPDGDAVSLNLLVSLAETRVGQLVEQSLNSFGFDIDVTQHSTGVLLTIADRGEFDLLQWWTGGTPHSVYDVTSTSGFSLGYGLPNTSTDVARLGKPVTPSIPTKPGSLTNPDEQIDLYALWTQIRTAETTREASDAISTIARWWNFDLPDIDLATARRGVWGNTGDFAWPDANDSAYRITGIHGQPVLAMLKDGSIEPRPG